VGIAAAAVIVIAGLSFVLKMQLVTIAVVVIGGAGIFLLLRQEDDDYGDDGGSTRTRTKPAKAKKGKARLDEILDEKSARAGGTATKRAPARSTPPSGGLPTWTPGSVDSGATDDTASSGPDDNDSSWDTWEKEWPSDADTLILEEDDPLSSLDRLDDIDPVAEVERLDAEDDPFASLRSEIEVDLEADDTFELDELTELDDEPIVASSGSGFSFSSAPSVINEEVSTADDIMAASTATELHVEDAGDSELARLLAKVQARLSAYE
jgi:hypothetical protein